MLSQYVIDILITKNLFSNTSFAALLINLDGGTNEFSVDAQLVDEIGTPGGIFRIAANRRNQLRAGKACVNDLDECVIGMAPTSTPVLRSSCFRNAKPDFSGGTA